MSTRRSLPGLLGKYKALIVILSLVLLVPSLLIGSQITIHKSATVRDTTGLVFEVAGPVPSPGLQQAPVDGILARLDWGRIVLSAPKKVPLEESRQVTLRLSANQATSELQESLDSNQMQLIDKARISDRMEATLTGQSFKVMPISPLEQLVAKGKETEWKWEIMPIRQGEQVLHLALSSILNFESRYTPLVVRTYEATITVEVSTLNRIQTFLSANWSWAWASILVPVLAFLARRWKSRQSNVR